PPNGTQSQQTSPFGTQPDNGAGTGPNLTIDKTVDPSQPCTADAAKATLTCSYIVTITNTGSDTFNGPINFQDIIPAGATMTLISVSPNAAFGCAGPQGST